MLLLLCACNGNNSPKVDESAYASAMNEGVGMMGRFEFTQAEAAFARALDLDPGSTAAALDKAIAVLNQTRDGSQEEALAQFSSILAREPGNVRANYCAGIALLYLGRATEAIPRLKLAVEASPEDAYAAYFFGQALEQTGSTRGALESYEHAQELDPFLRSIWLGIQRTSARLGESSKSAEALARFEELARNPRSRLAEFRYTRMGSLALATVGASTLLPRTSTHAAGKAFIEGMPILGHMPETPASGNATVQAVDLDGDDDSDLVVSGWNEDGSSRIYLRDEDGFRLEPDHPLARVPGVRCMLFGDVNADTMVDAFVCRDGENLLLYQKKEGSWAQSPGPLGGSFDTVDGAMADLDHDGDLDFYCVNADGPNELLNNNGDGTFLDIAVKAGVDGGNRASRQVMVGDLDLDRDADIVVLNDEPPNDVWLNDRLWSYSRSDDFASLEEADLVAIVPWYGTPDGLASIRSRSRGGMIENWVVGAGGRWTAVNQVQLVNPRQSEPVTIDLADVTGDGRQDLLVARDGGFEIRGHTNQLLATPTPMRGNPSDYDALGMTVLFENGGRGPGVVVLSRSRGPLHYPPTEDRGGFAAISFSGRDDTAQQMRSNASGIGVRWAARIGSHWQAGATWRRGSGPGQGLQPVAIGLGEAESIDFVEIDWPDGVFQTELAVDRGVHAITETQRQISSCPLVFVREEGASSFMFLTDVLGVGGLGYLVEPGVPSEPRPHESLLLPYEPAEIRIAEPMEEACYLDGVRLVAVDAPGDCEIVLDERMAIGGMPATSRAFAVHDMVSPVSARNERGKDELDAIRFHDLVAADPGALDSRFIGRLSGEYMLEFSFAEPIDSHDVLLIEGWIEYPYSQTNFAAWQSGATFDAPTLEARSPGGDWVEVAPRFGYPAGMPRAMSLPMFGLPEGPNALRLRTNQEIYWDRIRVAKRCPVQLGRFEAELLEASVSDCGFPVRTTGTQRQPSYDYGRRVQFGDVRHQAGFYTGWGDCRELVAMTDDASAIIGPGEEIRLRFKSLPPPVEGMTRRWVLELDGWCKDMDLFTVEGERLDPLPARENGDPGPFARELMRRFNTRFASGR
jgi:Tfp pilus assembly protein PilF